MLRAEEDPSAFSATPDMPPGSSVAPRPNGVGSGNRMVVRAQFPFEARDRSQLSLSTNDEVRVLHCDRQRWWWYGTSLATGARGWFPANFVTEGPAPIALPVSQ